MKKLLITLIAALFVSGAVAQTFPDIPEGHWAGEAVEDIADLNIVIGFPDGTYRGNEAFTRYQAALVISRMLDVINANMDAAMAMTEEDLAALRNAVQELAADVAAQGVRLSAAEGAIAGLSDDVTMNTARLDDLEAMLDGMSGDVDPAVLRDLQNQIASQRVATDTAQATADAAQGTADEALARANAADSAAQANAAEIAALNDLIQILGDQIESLQGMAGQGDGASADAVAALEGDIANIREFVILLRRDQVALRDQVAGLEASDAQQSADIADLQGRVTALEENPLGISGTIDLDYFVGRFSGVNAEFDVDRAYGIGMDRDIGASVFSSGTDPELAGDDEEVDEPGEYAQDRADIEYGSDFDADVTIELGAGFGFDGEGSPRGLNSFEAVIEFSLDEYTVVTDTDDDGIGDDTSEIYAFALDEFTATYDPIGAAPLTFAFGDDVDGDFTPYTLNRDGVGFVASVGSPEFLSFLDPTLQVAYLTEDYDGVINPQVITTGVRGTLSPIDGLTGGFSFVRNSENTGDKDDAVADNNDDTIWGVDAQAALGPVTLSAEYASANIAGGYQDTILFVQADAMLDILGGVELGANYRDIAEGWEANLGSGAVLTDEGDYPFEDDQTGFGVNAGLGLFIFDINAFFDSYSVAAGDDTTAFGVDASADLFRAFSVTGFYEQVSINGTVVDDNGATERDNGYDTGFGVGLVHDGAADNALISNLNLEFAFERLGAGFDETHILAAADYALDVSIVSLTPYVSYESYNDADASSDDTAEIKVGTGLATQPLDVLFQPSLEAAVNYRQNAHTDTGAGDYTATELQWAVGLNLGEFLLPYSSLSARYASYTGTNVDYVNLSNGDVDNGDAQGSVSGYEVEWNYYDLMVSYGVYTNVDAVSGDETAAQAFGVSYSVAF